MSDGMALDPEFNRMLDGFATLIVQHQARLESSVRTIADATQQIAARLSGLTRLIPSVIPPVTAGATVGETPAASAMGAGVAASVPSEPIKWWDEPKGPKEKDRWFGRRSLIRAIWEIDDYLMSNMGRLITRILDEVFKYLDSNKGVVSGLIIDIVAQVHAQLAPMIHTLVSPYLDWMVQLLQTGIGWLQSLINAGIQWLGSTVQVLIPFLQKVIVYLYETTVKTLANDLLYNVVFPFLEWAITDLYVTHIRFMIYDMLHTLVYPFLIWAIPGLVHGVLVSLAEMMAAALRGDVLPPPVMPVQPIQAPWMHLHPRPWPHKTLPGRPGTGTGAPAKMPRLELPPFTVPELVLPPPPAPAAPELPAATPGGAPQAPPTTEPITVNGGINVTISAATVDAEHADDVARQIASRVLDELRRLSDIDRFSRGLPTGGTS